MQKLFKLKLNHSVHRRKKILMTNEILIVKILILTSTKTS